MQVDRFFRAARLGERPLEAVTDETRQVLAAYSEGVNHYLENYMRARPIEFLSMHYWPPRCLLCRHAHSH